MTRLLQKDEKFNWTPECEATFHTLRTLLTTAPVLAQPDIEKPFDVFYDASGIGLWCVLMQEVSTEYRQQSSEGYPTKVD